MAVMVGKGAGDTHVSFVSPASSVMSAMPSSSTVPCEPNPNFSPQGVWGSAASLPVSSSTSHIRSGGNFSHSQSPIYVNHNHLFSHETSPVQSTRNKRRRERHQLRIQQKHAEDRAKKRRMIWNNLQQRVAQNRDFDRPNLPDSRVSPEAGYVRIGNLNMEKSNPEKLEQLCCLAAHRGWEVTIVSECCPTSRSARQALPTTCRHWKWEGWELVHTGSVGVLLNPHWSHAWHTFQAPKHRSEPGRVLSLVLPRDPASAPSHRPLSWIVTAVWAPISTSTVEALDEFWDEVACASRRESTFRPQCGLVSSIHEHTPHVIAGDFNAQLFEPLDHEDATPLVGRFRPPCRHQLDTYAYDKVASLDDWVHADSFRAPLGNRHRCTWFSSIHRQYYEIDWMLLQRRHLNRLVSFTMRHTIDFLHTQHSAKEYVFRLEQTKQSRFRHHVAKPDLNVLRGISEEACAARTVLADRVRDDCAMHPEPPSFSVFRGIVAQQTLNVCGEQRRSGRQPWLRSNAANALISPLNFQCRQLRRQKHDVQARLATDPENAQILVQLENIRQQHRNLKNSQRQVQRRLETEYWEALLAEHPTQVADSFQFFQSLRSLQKRGKSFSTARQNPFSPAEWRDHFENISSQPEFMDPEVQAFIETLPVSDAVRALSVALDKAVTDDEIRVAVRTLRCGAGGGDGVPPVVLKALFADQSLAVTIGQFVRTLWNTPASQWCDLGLDGPGLQVPLWKQKEPFNSMDKWRGVVLLWTIPRVLAKIVNKRGQDWFEQTALPVPSSFGFRRGLGTDDALFMVRRLNEEISAWQSFGWNEVSYEAGLMDLKKAYPTANKVPFFHLLTHHGLRQDGPFMNALFGFHCHRQYQIKTGPDLSSASLSEPYKPNRGFGEGDGTSPWAWNVLYSAIVRFAMSKRRANAVRRNLECGIPWRWQAEMKLSSSWTRKNDQRQCRRAMIESTIFADDTTLHGNHQELHMSDDRGPSGMDCFAAAVSQWGSQEHEGKRECHVYGQESEVCLVGGGISPLQAVQRNVTRGLKCWAKIRPSLKHTRLSHKLRGRILMTFVYSPLAYSCKTRATTQRNMSRLQSVMNTAMRYVCRTRLSRMKDQGINHSDLRVKLGIPPVDVAMAQEQMRWLGHIVRMPPNEPTTYAKTFARGTIDIGDFQKLASSAGGRISADRKSLPDTWVHLCHQHGFCEEEVEAKANDRTAWNSLIHRRFQQSLYDDSQQSHLHQATLPDPGLRPWTRPDGRRPPSPDAHERRLDQQRARRAKAKGQPKRAPAPKPVAVNPALPRQVRRNASQKTYYAGQNQRRVTHAEREEWEFVCDFPGCNLRFETNRALNIHKGKANKPGGAHSQLHPE